MGHHRDLITVLGYEQGRLLIWGTDFFFVFR